MIKPTIKECFEWSNNMEQSTLFFQYFESIDWMVGKKGNYKPMTNWKSALTGWITRSKPKQTKVEKALSNTSNNFIDKFWVRMTQIFGHKWTSSFGATPSKPWADSINRLQANEIKHGLDVMMKDNDEWPPTLKAFLKMCKSYRYRQTTIKRIPFKAIQHQRESTKGSRQSAMDKIHSLLA